MRSAGDDAKAARRGENGVKRSKRRAGAIDLSRRGCIKTLCEGGGSPLESRVPAVNRRECDEDRRPTHSSPAFFFPATQSRLRGQKEKKSGKGWCKYGARQRKGSGESRITIAGEKARALAVRLGGAGHREGGRKKGKKSRVRQMGDLCQENKLLPDSQQPLPSNLCPLLKVGWLMETGIFGDCCVSGENMTGW